MTRGEAQNVVLNLVAEGLIRADALIVLNEAGEAYAICVEYRPQRIDLPEWAEAIRRAMG